MIRWILAGMLLLLPPLAKADPPATVDMTVVLHDEKGAPAKDVNARAPDDEKCEHCPPLTLGRAVYNVLVMPDRDAPDQLWPRGVLAEKIKEDKAAALTVEQVTVIKRLLAKGYPSPIIVMQAYPLLDPNAKPGEVK